MKLTPLAIAPIAAICFGSLASAQQTAAGANRANTTGPTVAEFHAAPIDYSDIRLRAHTGKANGPVTEIGAGFRYQLPDQSLVVFSRCGADARCDQAALIGRVGQGGERAIAAVDEYVGACSLLTIGGREELQAVSVPAFPGEIVVLQRIGLSNQMAPSYLHGQYAAFAGCVADARKEVAAGRLKNPIGSPPSAANRPENLPGVFECWTGQNTGTVVHALRFIPAERKFYRANITDYGDRLFAWLSECETDRYQSDEIKRQKSCAFQGQTVTATETISYQGQQARIVRSFDAGALTLTQKSDAGLAPGYTLSCRRKAA